MHHEALGLACICELKIEPPTLGGSFIKVTSMTQVLQNGILFLLIGAIYTLECVTILLKDLFVLSREHPYISFFICVWLLSFKVIYAAYKEVPDD